MHKITKTLLFVTLLVLLIGITSAANVSDNTTSKVVKDTTDTQNLEVQKSSEKILEKKTLTKENNSKNVKTATKTVDVKDFNTLHNTLSASSYDNVIINIKSDIQLASSTTLANTIRTLTVNGNGKTINGNGKYQFLKINSGNVMINNLKISNCYAENGGAIFNSGTLTLKNSVISSNKVDNSGAGIFNNHAKLTLTNCTLNYNKAGDYESYGGAIYNTYGTIIIIDSELKNNYALDGAGILNFEKCFLNITNSVLSNNRGYVGGAIFNQNSHITIKNSAINNNYAENEGGGIYNVDGYLNIINSNLNNNFAEYDGGAIYSFYDSNIKITNSELKNNIAIYNGGAIYNKAILTIAQSTLNNNKVTATSDKYESDGGGGAIFNNEARLTMTQTTLNNNIAKYTGGAMYCDKSNITITHSQINNNKAEFSGAIENTKGNLNIINTTLNNNMAHDSGAISHDQGNLIINNCSFKDNTAEHDIGAIYNGFEGHARITKTLFKNNMANRYGGALSNSQVMIIDSCQFEGNKGINTYSCGGAIDSSEDLTVKNSIFKNNAAENGGAISISKSATIEKNIFTDNKANTKGKTIINYGTGTITNNINSETSRFNGTIYARDSKVKITNNIFADTNVIIKLSPIRGIIGENIILKAVLNDEKSNKITGGNLAFKLNGKTLRSDGRFDSNAPAMKFNVKNGLVTYTIKADLYLRNAKNLEASYSGTNNYNESTSPSATAQIQKRNTQVTLTTTPTRAKQYETLTFKITAKDTTKNSKNNTLIYTNTKVMLKVNGVTLKNGNEKPVYVTLNKNAPATYKYTIPAGTGGITASKTARNYKVEAIFVGDNYYPGAKNSTSFQVERSPTTVTITQAIATKTNILNVKATLKDFKGNNLIGTNKVTIKINGKSYTKNGKPVYWSVKNGNVDLTGIQVDPKTIIKRILLVTGERQAYLEGRAETTNITRTQK